MENKANNEEEIIIETEEPKKVKKVKSQKTKKECPITFSLVPTLLYIISIGLTLFAQFLFICSATVTPRIFLALAILTTVGGIVINSLEIFKNKQFVLKAEYALAFVSIIALCV